MNDENTEDLEDNHNNNEKLIAGAPQAGLNCPVNLEAVDQNYNVTVFYCDKYSIF